MRTAFSIFGQRLAVVMGFQILLVLTLIGRLFFLQVIDQEKYSGLSDRNRIRVTLQAPLRGSIMDRHGKILAESAAYYNARVVCADKTCREKCRDTLQRHNIPVASQVFDRKDNKPFLLKERLAWDEIAFFEAHKTDFPMIEIQTLYERTYAMDAATPHFLGYTSRIPEDHPYAKKLPFSMVGRSGLEKQLDEGLFGIPTLLEEEVNAYGDAIRTLSFNKGTKGNDVTLTIDRELQSFVYQQLEPHKSGAVVVMDVTSGEILALASYPSFNPGVFEKGLSKQAWAELKENIQTPLVDKTMMGMYSPGSVIKPLVALAALQEGYITSETRFTCRGVTLIDGQPCHCWKGEGHGSVNLPEAIRGSCNIYMYEIAKLMPPELLTKWFKMFGMGDVVGRLPGEKKGLVPTAEWKQTHRKERWRRIDTVYMSIGQGYMLATPVQLAKMMALMVNGGQVIRPHLIKDAPSEALESLPVYKRNLDTLVHAMGLVVNHPNGTGYRNRPMDVDWQMGGKSGTAQVRRITLKERKEGLHHGYHWEWKHRDHGLFAGFAPLHNPKYVVVVLVEHGGFGGVVAAPIGRDVMKFLMENKAR